MTFLGQELKPVTFSSIIISFILNTAFVLLVYVCGIKELPILLAYWFGGFTSSMLSIRGLLFNQSSKVAAFLLAMVIIMACVGLYLGAFIQAYL